MSKVIGTDDYKNSIIQKSIELSYFGEQLEKAASCDYDEGMIKKASEDPEKQKKVKKVMDEWKSGKLKSSSGDKVTDQKQAIAIAMSEAGLSKSEEAVDPNKKEKDGSDKYDKMKDTQFGAAGKIKDKIQKSFDAGLIDEMTYLKANVQLENLIEKAGEGSKGGHVIGHTRSGKPIYENGKHSDYKNFHEEDHYEAAMHHSRIQDNERVKKNSHETLAKIAESEKNREGVKEHTGKARDADKKELHHGAQQQYHLEESKPNSVRDRYSEIGKKVEDIRKK